MCSAQGIAPPTFEEIGGFAVVTSEVNVLGQVDVTPKVAPQVAAILRAATSPVVAADLQQVVELKDRMHFPREYLHPLIEQGWLARTLPEKPRSRLQRYVLTEAGRRALEMAGPSA